MSSTNTIRNHNPDLREVIINSAVLPVDPEKLEQYMKAVGTDKENPEKLAAMWYAAQMAGSRPPSSQGKRIPSTRPIMLIPAGNGSTTHLASPPMPAPAGVYMSPRHVMVPPYHNGMATLPYMRPPPIMYPPPGSMPGTFRTNKSSRSGLNQQRRRKRAAAAAQQLRSGKMEADRRQRRKSEADVVDGQENFQYHGLDRAIAENFLARQEQSNAGSHVDYSSSSSGGGGTYGEKAKRSSASSKTKIICNEVGM